MFTTAVARRAHALQALAAILVGALTITLLPPPPARADDPDPRIGDLAEGLLAWGVTLDRAGELGPLAETIPLTVATPGALAGLDSGAVQSTVVEAAMAFQSAGNTSMGDFLDALDSTHIDQDGLETAFSVTGIAGEDDERGDLFFDLEVEITRTVDVPLFYDEDTAEDADPELDGGLPTLFLRQGRIADVQTAVVGTFRFGLVVEQGDTQEDDVYSFEIRDPADAGLTITVDAEDGIADFLARYGTTDADATATSAALDLTFDVDLVDPGASGTGTVDLRELTETNPLDLFAITAGGSMHLDLELTQEQLFADERITLTADGSVDGTFPLDRDPVFPAVDVTIGPRFAPFGDLGVEDVLVGLSEVALAIRAASAAGDVDLPLLGGSLADVADPGGTLLEFVRERSEVLISCGSVDSSPPQGVPRDGGIAYCQAFANLQAEPGTVAWELRGDPDAGFVVPTDTDATFGIAPEANVTVPTDRIADLRVTWDLPEADRSPDQPITRSGVPRFQTVQELAVDLARDGYADVDPADAVATLLGITEVAGIGTAEKPIDVVTLDLSTTIDEPVDLPWRVDDSLRQGARIASARADGEPPTARATPDGELNATVGIVLDPDLPRPHDAEREVANSEQVEQIRGRFLLTDGADDLIEVATLTVAEQETLPGLIGFLPVELDLALEIGPGTDVLTVGIDPTTEVEGQGLGVQSSGQVQRPDGTDGWVRVADLIAYLDPYADPEDGPVAIPPRRGFEATVDLAASVGVEMRDRMDVSAHSSGLDLEESFTASWTADETAAPGESLRPKVPGRFTFGGGYEAYKSALRPFDVAPEVRGTGTGGTDRELQADVDFTDAFGVTADTHIDATLVNVTQGGTCRGFTVQANSLECHEPLPPDDEDTPMVWTAGDEFVVEGDGTALRRIATRALRVGAGGLATSDNDALFASLPQLDLRAVDLVPLEDLADVLDAFAEAVESDQGETAFDDDTTGAGIATLDAAAPNLAKLVDALAGALDDQLTLDGPGSRAVSVGVRVAQHGDVPHLVLELEVSDTGRSVSAPIRLRTQEQGTIVEDGEVSVVVGFDATTTVAVGVPLADGTDPRDIAILHDTAVTVSLSADDDEIATSLLIGGSTLDAGVGSAVVAGQVGDYDDPDAAGLDATTTLFDADAEFAERGVVAGAEVSLLDDAGEPFATCVVDVDGVTSSTVRCGEALQLVEAPPAPTFVHDDAYQIVDGDDNEVASGTIGDYADEDAPAGLDPAIDLYDPDGEFDGVSAGHVVRLREDDAVVATCVVASVNTDDGVVHCAEALQAVGPAFTEGADYEIDVEGQGYFALALDVTLTHPGPGAASSPREFFDQVVGTWTGDETGRCADEAACVALSLRAAEEDTGRAIALGTLVYGLPDDFSRTADGSGPDATFDEPLPFAVLPQPAIDALGLRPLDLFNVATAGRYLERLFADAFDGSLTQTSLPLVGTELDAGAGVADVFADLEAGLQGGLVETDRDSLGETLEDAIEDDFDPATDNYRDFITAHITDYLEGFLGNVGPDELDVTATVDVVCDEPCDALALVSDIRIDLEFAVGAFADDGDPIGCDPEDQNSCVTGGQLPFDAGIPGLPVTLPPTPDDPGGAPPMAVEADYRWATELAIGISKDEGPYLAPHGGDGDDEARLTLGAFGRFADTGCTPSPRAEAYAELIQFPIGGANAARCGDALLGILPGKVYDGQGSGDQSRRSAVQALVTVNAAAGRVDFGALLDGRRAPVAVSSRARINLLFETNAGHLYEAVFDDSVQGALPGVFGTFHALANDHDADVDDPLYYYQALALDPVPFMLEFLLPIAETIKDLTDPFTPVLDLVTTPIPIVSELSQLTGGGPVTMLTLLDAITDNDLTLLERIIEAVKFANAVATNVAELDGFVPIGPGQLSDIDLNGDEDGEDEWEIDVDWENLTAEISGGGFTIEITDPDDDDDDGKRKRDSEDKQASKGEESKADKKEATQSFRDKVKDQAKNPDVEKELDWSGPALSFPVLDDPDEVFGMLLGRDAVLVRFDAGTLKASVSVSWTFGPFAAGPVLFDVGIGGKITLEGRFALGYDTYGFSRLVRGENAFISPFLDGLYLDDLDADGNDVEEVKLITTISASAALSIWIIRAGLEAEVTLTLALNLNDRRGDGRIRIEDIHRFRNDPICLFIFTGTLGFALNVFIELNLVIKKIKFSFTIWELNPPLNLFEFACDPPQPVFGSLVNPIPGADAGWLPPGDWDRAFKLNVGADADKRGIFPEEVDERFIIRQRSALDGVDLTSGAARDELAAIGVENTGELGAATEGTLIEIEGFGENLLYALPAGTVLWAETGAGDDTILLEPGTAAAVPDNEERDEELDEEDEEEFDFTIPAWLQAGNQKSGGGIADEDDRPGRNRFDGGDGGNVLIGHLGNDTLRGGRESDYLFGAGGDNNLDGALNDNVILGGPGDDRLTGGPGSDLLIGAGGRNQIEGGPGLRRGTEPPGRSDLVDTGNVLIGGPGANNIIGGPSTDYVLAGGWPSGVLGDDDVPAASSASAIEALLRAETAVSPALVTTAVHAQTWALGVLGSGKQRGTALDRGLAGDLCRAAARIPAATDPGSNDVKGHRGDDLVVGGIGDDLLEAGRGDDIVCVPDGDNVLEAGRGNNELHGGAGNDRLLGGPGNDWLTGGGGENYLEAGGAKNLLIGGVGADVLAGGQTGELLIADGGPPSGDAGIYLRDGVDGFVRVAPPSSDPLTIGDWAPLVAASPPDPFDLTVTGLYEETDADGFTQALGELSACRSSAQVLANGRLDLEGDGFATSSGRFQGHRVQAGLVQDPGGGNLNGIIAGAAVRNGRVDLDADGSNGPAGRLGGAAIGYLQDGRANCVLGGDARDAIFGGPASDHIHAGFGDDFVDAGPGKNLVRGGPGYTVLFGGPHSNAIFGDSGDDAIFGGPSRDILDGGPGDDYLEGNQGNDELRGGAGDDVLIGGSSGTADDVYRAAGPGDTEPRAWWETDLSSPSGNDTLSGEAGDDLVVGDNLRIEADGRLAWWEPGDEEAWLDAATGTDPAFDEGDETCPRDDGPPDARGPVFGGCDVLHGGNGENALIGGLGDDVLHAGTDHSYLFGDLAWFWPTSGAVDTWLGGQPAWHGVLFGDLAGSTGAPVWWDVVKAGSASDDPPYAVAPSDPGGATHWPGGAARYDALLAAPNVGGDDHLVGSPGDDHLYAGAGDDVLEGESGDDYLEGGPGDDRLYGETEALALAASSAEVAGAGLGATVEGLFSPRGGLLILSSGASPGSDLIGGSSAVHPDAADPDGSGASSGRDIIVGADDEDVMLGDNGEIRRLVDGASPGNPGAWAVDAITGGRARDPEPYDLHRLADDYRFDPGKPGSGALGTLEDAALDGPGGLRGARTLGGDDVIVGIDGRNRAYGGPGDDYVRGGPDDDYAEGGPGDDWLEGGGGDDDLIGGGSFAADDSPRALDTGATDLGTEGFPSGANVVLGQGGQNVIAGDNARVLRADPDDPATVGAEAFDTYLATDGRFVGFTTPRWVSLLDLDDPRAPTIGGDDLLSAGPGNSLLFGQGGDDWASGGAGDDYAEGNAGDDVLLGDRPFGITPDGDEATATDIATADLLAERPTIARRGHTLEAFRWPADQRADDRYRNTRVADTGPTPVADLEGLADEIAAVGDGQDDLIGGNSRPALPAGDDTIYGDGGDDFALGDNAEVIRAVDGDAYVRYDERYDPAFAGARTIVRTLIEFDVGASLDCGEADAAWDCDDPARPWGDDFLDGGAGDDTLHGQDGGDELWGSPQDDDIRAPGTSWGDHLVGGLGDDRLYGGPGNDVLVGDRGSIITRYLTDSARRVTFTANGPPFMTFAGREQGDLHHEVDLYCKEDRSGAEPRFFAYGPDGCNLGGSGGLGDPDSPVIIGALHNLRYSHHSFGGDDLLRGGPGDTVIYGGGGNDVLQGDEGADMLFGGRGSNVLYGGEGEPGVDSTRPADYARANDRDHVDWLFGGRGESMLDYRPRVRPGHHLDAGWADAASRLDPGLWFEMTRPYWHPDDVDDATFAALRDHDADLVGAVGPDGTAAGALADVAMTTRPQHHQGVTWAYGGWGRKVHQLSVSSNPPDAGDRFMDVVGNFNLFTHCSPHYGSDNISRELRPHTDDVVHLMAVIGGAGPDLATLRTPGTSGFDQIAFIHPRIDGSVQANTGAAFRDVQLTWGADLPGVEPVDGPGATPGHRYDTNIACPGGGVVP